MANEEHLARLKEGVEAWNEWRSKNPGIQPDLSSTNFTGHDLERTDIHELDLGEMDLYKVDLSGADLREARFYGMDLSEIRFPRANLCRAGFDNAYLLKTDFTGANLTEARFGETHFIDTNFNAANLYKAIFGWTTLSHIDLSTARGLDTIQHEGPSTIGIDTLYRSHGQIPEVFLRGCGVPDEFITYVKSLVERPFDYHSCFISYSSKDTALAERLYADLQATGVRCWFAPEDMKIGDKFRSRIDEAIHLHDKLLIILSKHSLVSPWVEKEVETAFAKETKEQRSVLFPVRVDQAIMQRDTGWAADIHRTRHIGDFRRWKNHEAYRTAFDRLLRDLKAANQ